MLYIHKKELSSDTIYNMDKTWQHAKWKKLDIKGHILFDSIYLKCSEYANPQKHKVD